MFTRRAASMEASPAERPSVRAFLFLHVTANVQRDRVRQPTLKVIRVKDTLRDLLLLRARDGDDAQLPPHQRLAQDLKN